MTPESMTDILDIARNVRSVWPERILWIALVLFLFAAFFLGVYFYKKRRRIVLQKTAEETALESLQMLAKVSGFSFDDLYLQLTTILKRYVTNGLGVDFLDKTCEEIRILAPKILPILPEEELLNAMFLLLQQSESIKFAKQQPSASQFSADLQFVTRFVQKSAQWQKTKVNEGRS